MLQTFWYRHADFISTNTVLLSQGVTPNQPPKSVNIFSLSAILLSSQQHLAFSLLDPQTVPKLKTTPLMGTLLRCSKSAHRLRPQPLHDPLHSSGQLSQSNLYHAWTTAKRIHCVIFDRIQNYKCKLQSCWTLFWKCSTQTLHKMRHVFQSSHFLPHVFPFHKYLTSFFPSANNWHCIYKGRNRAQFVSTLLYPLAYLPDIFNTTP